MIDKGNLDNSKRMVKALAMVFVLITVACVGAFALSTVFSNHVTDQVTVPEQEIVLTAGTVLPDAPAKGVAYEMSVSIDYQVEASDAYLNIVFGKAGINAGDVTVFYGATQVSLTDMGDTLTGSTPIPATDGTVTLSITFNVSGTYTTDLQVEALA